MDKELKKMFEDLIEIVKSEKEKSQKNKITIDELISSIRKQYPSDEYLEELRELTINSALEARRKLKNIITLSSIDKDHIPVALGIMVCEYWDDRNVDESAFLMAMTSIWRQMDDIKKRIEESEKN